MSAEAGTESGTAATVPPLSTTDRDHLLESVKSHMWDPEAHGEAKATAPDELPAVEPAVDEQDGVLDAFIRHVLAGSADEAHIMLSDAMKGALKSSEALMGWAKGAIVDPPFGVAPSRIVSMNTTADGHNGMLARHLVFASGVTRTFSFAASAADNTITGLYFAGDAPALSGDDPDAAGKVRIMVTPSRPLVAVQYLALEPGKASLVSASAAPPTTWLVPTGQRVQVCRFGDASTVCEEGVVGPPVAGAAYRTPAGGADASPVYQPWFQNVFLPQSAGDGWGAAVVREYVGRRIVVADPEAVAATAGASLVPLEPTPLSDADRRACLASAKHLEHDEAAFTAFLDEAGLRAGEGEGPVALALRVMRVVAERLTYTDEVPKRLNGWSHPAVGVEAGETDCGGHVAIFVSAMRANGVPARGLCGHRLGTVHEEAALSAAPAPGPFKAHVVAEFYADGVGWVPVECTAKRGPSYGVGADLSTFCTRHFDFGVEQATPAAVLDARSDPALAAAGAAAAEGGEGSMLAKAALRVAELLVEAAASEESMAKLMATLTFKADMAPIAQACAASVQGGAVPAVVREHPGANVARAALAVPGSDPKVHIVFSMKAGKDPATDDGWVTGLFVHTQAKAVDTTESRFLAARESKPKTRSCIQRDILHNEPKGADTDTTKVAFQNLWKSPSASPEHPAVCVVQ